MELENISQWMYKAHKNKFQLLIIKKLLLTFGTNIFSYCFFMLIFMREFHFSYITILLYEIFVLIAVFFTIIVKFLWSNPQIVFLFIHGPNATKKKEHFIRYKNDLHLDQYQAALSR